MLQVGEVSVGFRGQPLVFATTPQDFNAIEFGAVRREVKQGHALFFPRRELGFKSGRGVTGRVVEDDNGWLGEGLAEVIKKQDDVHRFQAFGRGIGVEVRAVVAQESGHVEARPAGGFQGNRFARGLPGAGHVGNKGKCALSIWQRDSS